jgi:predicted SprT family Zn-dependent metalloprotease
VQDAIDQLILHYSVTNREKFNSLLPEQYRIVFNQHLRRLTGRITYGLGLIEISLYHFQQYGYGDAVQTLEHEMLHLYLHKLGKPSGHNSLFKQTARVLGIRVFHSNPYPRNQPSRHRHVYECPACGRMVFRRRLQRHQLACGVCCRVEAEGRWDERFELKLVSTVKMA